MNVLKICFCCAPIIKVVSLFFFDGNKRLDAEKSLIHATPESTFGLGFFSWPFDRRCQGPPCETKCWCCSVIPVSLTPLLQPVDKCIRKAFKATPQSYTSRVKSVTDIPSLLFIYLLFYIRFKLEIRTFLNFVAWKYLAIRRTPISRVIRQNFFGKMLCLITEKIR